MPPLPWKPLPSCSARLQPAPRHPQGPAGGGCSVPVSVPPAFLLQRTRGVSFSAQPPAGLGGRELCSSCSRPKGRQPRRHAPTAATVPGWCAVPGSRSHPERSQNSLPGIAASPLDEGRLQPCSWCWMRVHGHGRPVAVPILPGSTQGFLPRGAVALGARARRLGFIPNLLFLSQPWCAPWCPRSPLGVFRAHLPHQIPRSHPTERIFWQWCCLEGNSRGGALWCRRGPRYPQHLVLPPCVRGAGRGLCLVPQPRA